MTEAVGKLTEQLVRASAGAELRDVVIDMVRPMTILSRDMMK